MQTIEEKVAEELVRLSGGNVDFTTNENCTSFICGVMNGMYKSGAMSALDAVDFIEGLSIRGIESSGLDKKASEDTRQDISIYADNMRGDIIGLALGIQKVGSAGSNGTIDGKPRNNQPATPPTATPPPATTSPGTTPPVTLAPVADKPEDNTIWNSFSNDAWKNVEEIGGFDSEYHKGLANKFYNNGNPYIASNIRDVNGFFIPIDRLEERPDIGLFDAIGAWSGNQGSINEVNSKYFKSVGDTIGNLGKYKHLQKGNDVAVADYFNNGAAGNFIKENPAVVEQFGGMAFERMTPAQLADLITNLPEARRNEFLKSKEVQAVISKNINHGDVFSNYIKNNQWVSHLAPAAIGGLAGLVPSLFGSPLTGSTLGDIIGGAGLAYGGSRIMDATPGKDGKKTMWEDTKDTLADYVSQTFNPPKAP